MEIIDQHTKEIMEDCKMRAREAGLRFQDETLEYIVTNKDLLELGPKNMIPTLYDYWVHDVEVLKEKGKYELYPHNPYETVINTKPAISFYNDNNPDWLNVMIFYHVIAHIDFFQNNLLFKHTWNDDFAGQALSDKRTIALLRSEKGRWVDYVIEFTRGIDNLVGFFEELSFLNLPDEIRSSGKVDYYFDFFLQNIIKVSINEYYKEIDRYNETLDQFGQVSEPVFFSLVAKKYPEFEALFERQNKSGKPPQKDLIQFIEENSPFLRKEENKWMKTVMEIVRNTSVYFQPQTRTKILNEGWASYWHDRLFMNDERIRGHEVSYARVNAGVTALPQVGLNPYALGMRLFAYLEEMADKGRITYTFQRLQNAKSRTDFDRKTGEGLDFIFSVRENFSDFNFLNTFLDQDFMDRHKLFVAGRRLNAPKGVWEYYIKSKKVSQYKEMLLESLYHPPCIEIDETKSSDGALYLTHRFEEKPLVREFIENTMIGIEYLWGGPVKLETTELHEEKADEDLGAYAYLAPAQAPDGDSGKRARLVRTLYTMAGRKLARTIL